MGRGGYCAGCGSSHAQNQRFCDTCGRSIGAADGDTWVGASLGRYEIERVIASGGMGVVYAARDPQLGRTIALKLLREDLVADEEFRRRFVRESRSAAALDHPNILPVFDAGEIDGVLFIATRLVDARDLRQVLAEEGRLPVQRALSIAAQLAAALDFAHEHGTVHRDVKPANLLVVPGRDGDPDHAYLIDFGITKQASRDHTLTASGMFLGTPEYSSPEQARAGRVDGRSDQYALGCLLHHCLAGAPPFSSPSAIDVLHAHLYAEPPPLRTLRRDVPASVESAVLRALNKEPAERFATCRAFVAAARSGTGLPERAVPAARATVPLTRRGAIVPTPSPPPRTPRPPAQPGSRRDHRGPGLVAAGVVIAVLAAAGAAAGALFGRGSDSPRNAAFTTTTIVKDGETRTVTLPTTTPTTTPAVPLSVSDLDMTRYEQAGFSLELPSGWNLVRDDESQPTSPGVTRMRTEAASTTLGLSVVVDRLSGYEVSPERNREVLIEGNRRRPGYRTVGRSEFELDGSTAYEFHYRFVSESGVEARRVNVLFREGDSDFGVLAGGNAAYDDLSALARATARSIALTPADPAPDPDPEPTPAREPDPGVYEGTGDQTGSVVDDFSIELEFDGSGGGKVRYLDNDCSGSLRLDSRDDGAVLYTETIETGDCAPGGTWRITVHSDSAVTANWRSPDRGYVVDAELTR